jgi:hypothetical protein
MNRTQPALRAVASEAQAVTSLPSVSVGLTTLQGFELAQRAAKCLATSTLVPKEYQGNLSNCIIALNMAQRLGADPLMVMQNLYLVHGRPSWSAPFMIASFNQCGRFDSIRYEWRGKQGDKDWGCRAYATEKASGDRIESAWIDWKLVEAEGWNKRQGSKWLTMPQQMFMYRAASWLVRAYAPELSMGLQTSEEMHDVYDTRATETGSFEVVDIPEVMEAVDAETGEMVAAE